MDRSLDALVVKEQIIFTEYFHTVRNHQLSASYTHEKCPG